MFKSLSIVAPIVELTEATRKIGKGDLGSRITVRSVDRIGELGGAFNDMAAGLAERERERSIFGRVVDPRVRDRLLEKTESGNGELRRATVVFFDLAGFTALSEHLPPVPWSRS
jgi:adenylate cyclase